MELHYEIFSEILSKPKEAHEPKDYKKEGDKGFSRDEFHSSRGGRGRGRGYRGKANE